MYRSTERLLGISNGLAMIKLEPVPEWKLPGSSNNEEKNIPVLCMICMRQIVFKSSQSDFGPVFLPNKIVLPILF